MDVYIGNLHTRLKEEDLKVLFESFGTIISATVIKDRVTGNSKGFGFVKMHNAIDAQRAIDDLNGAVVSGRKLVVYESKPKEERKNNAAGNSKVSASRSGFIKNQRTYNEKFGTLKSEDMEVSDDGEDDILLEVKNQTRFTKKISKDGYVSISFKD